MGNERESRVNGKRTKKSIKDSDVVVVKFGEKYKQWNAAFDAGYASALNKSLIVIQNEDQGGTLHFQHPNLICHHNVTKDVQ